MRNLLAVLALVLAGSTLRADAILELRGIAGAPASDLPKIAEPVPVPVTGSVAEVASPVIRATSAKWNSSFPISKEAVEAAGKKVGKKAWSSYFCIALPGKDAVSCDFAFDVWPESCWYGHDHVLVQIDVKEPSKITVINKTYSDK